MMNEFEFTESLVNRLRSAFPGLEVDTRKSLFYALYIDEDGNIPLHLNEKREPIRGGGTGFEQDILLFECVAGETSIVPRVVIEIKFDRVTTHEAIVYSKKAGLLRNVYPYLRYGFVMGGMSTIPPRVLRLGLGFDFILSISNPPTLSEMGCLVSLLSDEWVTSRKLGQAFLGLKSVSMFRRRVDIEPDFDIFLPSNVVISKTPIQPEPVQTDILSGLSYYVYENWRAENKAKIHFGHCSSCNYGIGKNPNASDLNGRWHGPFQSFNDAEQAAINTGRTVMKCKICTPHP